MSMIVLTARGSYGRYAKTRTTCQVVYSLLLESGDEAEAGSRHGSGGQ